MEKYFTSIRDFIKRRDQEKESAVFYAERVLERMVAEDRNIHAFGHIDKKEILERARTLDKTGRKGGMWAVPVAVKDNICIKDTPTTCASRVLNGFTPPYNATDVDRLNAAGMLLISGANMDEFAFGSSCETSCYGPTRNPSAKDRIPGGSSGGSAASVAAGIVPAALGSDTGGSIRQPASMCGVVGMKPTYGRVSRYGLIAFASSLDQIGPITGNVADCASILEIISGYDENDSTSVDLPVPKYTDLLTARVPGMKIGIPEEYFQPGIDEDVRRSIQNAVKVFKDMGAEIINISLPHTKYAVSCYYIIGPAEASSNLARYDGVHYGYRSEQFRDLVDMYVATRSEGFGPEAKRRILLGSYSLSSGYYDAYYLKAQKVRTEISNDFKKAFGTCDCILTPTSPTTAFKIGERTGDPLKMYLSDIFTIPANLAGIPAISVPCGKDAEGLPIGLQLMAPHFREDTLIRVSSAFEANFKTSGAA